VQLATTRTLNTHLFVKCAVTKGSLFYLCIFLIIHKQKQLNYVQRGYKPVRQSCEKSTDHCMKDARKCPIS